MPRLRRWSAFGPAILTAFLVSTLRAETPLAGQNPDNAAEKWHLDLALEVSPRAAPVPALKYRLFPLASERREGNAVLLYLRMPQGYNDATKKLIHEKPLEWNKLPPEKIPLDEAKKFLGEWKYPLRQMELAARRTTTDWGFALDTGSVIELLIPDVAELRNYGPLLALKARVETADGRYDDAARTLETGFSFSRQFSEAPFFISALVGATTADRMLDVVPDLVQRPDAPNLYWALAVMPRPLIDIQRGLDYEQRLIEMQFPDLGDLARGREPESWDVALARVRAEAERLFRDNRDKDAAPGGASTDPAASSPELPAARKYLTQVVGLKAAAVDAMPPAKLLLLHLFYRNRQIADDYFKVAYLPYPQMRPLFDQQEKRLKALPKTEATRLTRMLLPAIQKVKFTQVRVERKIAALRAVEALRIYAAAHDGALPDSLADVTEAPVPDDPSSGKPFEYRRDGATATLISRLPGEPTDREGLRYRVTIRK
jgi:hypothetical protein